MNTQLLEIQPNELKFLFELKKQSSCSIRLTNLTDSYVAFKVKTTSPKKYCVRPNVGVVLPKSTSEFSVTMQAPQTGMVDMECKDKFLIQSTIVSSRTTDEDITASMFSKDGGKYIEEKKLRVTLFSPPNSPMLSPMKVDLKQGLGYEHSVLKDQFGGVEILPSLNQVTKDVKFAATNEMRKPSTDTHEKPKPSKDVELKPGKDFELKPEKDFELKPEKDVELKPAKYEALEPEKEAELKPVKDVELKSAKDVELKPEKEVELKPEKEVELKPEKEAELKPVNDVELKSAKDVELKPPNVTELKLEKDVELNATKIVEDLKLVKDIQEMKSKLNALELKLSQAEVTISKLTEERSSSIQETRNIQQQLAQLGIRGVDVKVVQVGFPLLFVCMVAIMSVAIGYCIHP
ncbi:vesicle-associated protein 2-2 isoform X2 [Pyrus x bretschneideri]|uniref:vesicle-associated protein 2-2 isoform X2 n=1 Tax=Pyrus x bretschneideri TaxID=225117 RepID=UPI002030EE20|nr:vesicle-associated protein 2-2 isoform X2 [Pyrus x bretschneideri]